MRSSLVIASVFAAGACFHAARAEAQSLRCRNDLANAATVASKCGEPAAKNAFCKGTPAVGRPGTPQPCLEVEEWTYRPAPGQLITILKFESGRLVSIEYGDRIP
jgi:hypothetical protein